MTDWPPPVEQEFIDRVRAAWISKLEKEGKLESMLKKINQYRRAFGEKPLTLEEFRNPKNEEE